MSENDVDKAVKRVQENEASVITILKEHSDIEGKGVVTLRREKVMPERMESPARDHIFHDVAGFTKFIDANKTPNTVVFADVEGVAIRAVLNDKAEKGFEIVKLNPPYHPAFNLLRDSLLNKTLPIEIFAQGVMRNRKIIKDTLACDAKSLAMAMQQLTVATAIVQAIGDGKTSVNGIMTTTTVTSGAPEAKEHLDLPDSISVEVPIYLNTDPVSFCIDITISTKQEMVIVTTDSPELELKKYEVFEEMMAGVKEIVGAAVVYGSPRHQAWAYNK